jgi:hypothetical protein
MCHNERDVWICVEHLSSGWKIVSLALKNLRHSITKTTFSLLLMLSKSVVLPSFTSSEARSPSTHLSDIHFYSDSFIPSQVAPRHASHCFLATGREPSPEHPKVAPKSIFSESLLCSRNHAMPCR